MSGVVVIKAGDTLSLSGTWTDSTGAAVDLTGYTITAKVKKSDGTLVDSLTCAILVAASGTFSMTMAAASTALWPLESLVCDVKFVSAGGTVTHSETFSIIAQEAVT